MPTKHTAPFRFTDPQVAKISDAGRQAQAFADKARNILQAAVDVASSDARGSGQLNALADILDGFSQGFRRLADLAHAQEAKGK